MPKQMSTILLRPGQSVLSQRVVDICLAVLIALPGLASLAHRAAIDRPTPWPTGVLLDLGLTMPLIWRRRAPAAVFAVISAVAFVQWLTGERIFGVVALLVAFYTVAARERRRVTLTAAVVLEVGVLLATSRWAGSGQGPLVFVLLSGMATAAGFIGTNMRTRRAYLAALEDRNARLELERDQQAQLAAAAERARIARDMHDVVAHNLSVMIALADGATFVTDVDPGRAATAMQQVSTTGRQALTEMRRLLGVLHDDKPAALQPQPGIADIDELVAQVRLTGLHGELVSEGRAQQLPAGLQLAVYRLVQEALTNTLKHGVEVQKAIVRLRFSKTRLDVEVVDDGLQADRAAAPGWPAGSTSGRGITGMRERAAAYGGSVEAGPRPGGGWQVKAAFDLSAQGMAT